MPKLRLDSRHRRRRLNQNSCFFIYQLSEHPTQECPPTVVVSRYYRSCIYMLRSCQRVDWHVILYDLRMI